MCFLEEKLLKILKLADELNENKINFMQKLIIKLNSFNIILLKYMKGVFL